MADRDEIAAEIEGLAVHCRPPLMAVDQRQRWIVDWCTDLSEYPIEAIRNAFRKWRQGDNGKFPTPGQILPAIRSQIASGPREVPQAWSYDITDEQYRTLSLSDKIRHHRIAATHCRQSAGPQWSGNGHVDAKDIPPVWHAWRQKAANHDAEASRLKKTLNDLEDRA